MGTHTYSSCAMAVLIEAQRIACKYRHQTIQPEHVLYALLHSESGALRRILTTMRKDADTLLHEDCRVLEQLPTTEASGGRHITVDLKLLLQTAEQLATDLGDESVSEEHLMLVLIDTAEGPLAREFAKQAITHARFARAITASGVGTSSLAQHGKRLHRGTRGRARLWT